MATRSLIRAGTGQYFASSFSDANKQEVRKIAREIYDDLFVPMINQISKKYGAGKRGLTALVRLYDYMLEGVLSGKSEVEIVPQLFEDIQLAFLAPLVDGDKGIKKNLPRKESPRYFLRPL